MKFFVLIMATFLSASAFANQASLRSSEGYQVDIYYSLKYTNTSSNKPSSNTAFTQLRIDVKGNFRPEDKVQAVLVNKFHKNGQCGLDSGTYQEVYRKTLTPTVVGVFQGEMTNKVEVRNMMTGQYMYAETLTIFSTQEGYCYSIENLGQELAIVVNGRWLTDPVTGAHNFNMNLR